MVGPGRFELPTSRLSGVRSNQLSYEPIRPKSPKQAWRLQQKERDTWTAALNQLHRLLLQRIQNITPDKSEIGFWISLKGGDPAAGSPTATLLRLHPSR